jgi:hypothetical protein
VQGASIGSGITYQGELKNANGPVDATCAFRFALYDAASGGAQVGPTLNQSVHVADGLFTVQLDFGAGAFNGKSQWLQVAVQCPGDPGYTPLAPRQQLTAVPYALSLMPGATISGPTNVGLTVENTATSTSAMASNGGAATALRALVAGNGTGVASRSPSGVAVQGESTSGTGVEGESITGVAVRGRSPVVAVEGESTSGTGVLGRSPTAVGVQGESTSGDGLWGQSTSGRGVVGVSVSNNGVHGESEGSSASGVFGANRANGAGVSGSSATGVGMYGTSISGWGVVGDSNASVGVYGRSDSGWAGWFEGNTHVNGTLSKAAGSFKIDHPLDPANKYLSHSFVESPDMKNIYDGIATTDANGEAVVELPSYFEALNRDFRYQLTVIGQFAQAIIADEIAGNHFAIKTDKPNVKVAWQVTGIRHDAYANAHRVVVEEDKPAAERGTYLHPTEQGQPGSKALGYAERQTVRRNLQSAISQPIRATLSEGR